MAAASGLSSIGVQWTELSAINIARCSYAIADAMLEEREKNETDSE